MATAAPARSPAVGDPAPGFDLPELGGGRLRLEDLRGRPLILTFLRHAG
jgi:peroxiredoxin Q/BCP